MGLRYFVAAIVENTPEKLAAVHVQRTRKQGHVDKREITLAVARLGDPSFDTRPTDFPVPRGSGMPALIASVRPVVGAKGCISSQEGVVLLLLRDPLWRNAATTLMLQELFSLTNAEAHLAQALCKWCNNESLCDRTVREPQHRLFDLKQIREKTGCKSMPELVRKFGE
jgi:hypothetical protein